MSLWCYRFFKEMTQVMWTLQTTRLKGGPAVLPLERGAGNGGLTRKTNVRQNFNKNVCIIDLLN